MDKHAHLIQQVEQAAAQLKKLKAETKDAALLQPQIALLIKLRSDLVQLESTSDVVKFDRVALEDLLQKRFFFTQSFQIYGGVAGLFDYGPPGCALQANMLDLWRKHFILEEDMLELDCTVLTPFDVLKTSGHVDRFSDLMCKDLKTGQIYRVDHLVEAEFESRIDDDKQAKLGKKVKGKEFVSRPKEEIDEYVNILAQIDNYGKQELSDFIKKYQIKSALGNELSEPEVFNLMFATPIGPTGVLKGFLRPETAQGQFVNFKKLLEYNNDRMPFASALIGRSFRNEISPRAGLLRVREFTMAEIEHYVHPDKKQHKRFHQVKDVVLNLLPAAVQLAGKSEVVPTKAGDAVTSGLINNETLGYFIARISLFLAKIGIKGDKLRFRQHLSNEMAHYACDCWDAEIHTSYGWVECVGCADRSAYDLTKHTERTGEKLVARETLSEPKVIEKLQLEINKKTFGPHFKKDAKDLERVLEGMDEIQLGDLQMQFESLGFGNVKAGDSEFKVPKEMVSIARVTEKVHVLEYTPNVIEPSFGIGRILYSLLEHVWWIRPGDENKNVLSFPACVAPIKCLLVPLSNNTAFDPLIVELRRKLRLAGVSNRVDDSSVSIGKRYARNDELGTPFAMTVDFQSVQDGTVTLRERDSTKQIRASADVVLGVLGDLVEERKNWTEVLEAFGECSGQDLSSE